MAVRVRLFAALREAAGTGEELVPAGPLPQVLDGLRARHGARFAAVLGMSSVLVDGDPVAREAAVDVADGAEVALLPPVSGGADDPPTRPSRVRADLPPEWVVTPALDPRTRSRPARGPAPAAAVPPAAPRRPPPRRPGPRPAAPPPAGATRGGARRGAGRAAAGAARRGAPGAPAARRRRGSAPAPARTTPAPASASASARGLPALVAAAGAALRGRAARVGAAVVVVGALAAVAGGPVWAVAVLAGAAVVLADLVVLLDRAAVRPVVPVAVALGLERAALIAAGARDLGVLPGAALALAVAATFARLALSRQHGAVAGALGATLVAALPVALGAGALLLLRDRPARAVLALLPLLLPAVARAGTAAATLGASPEPRVAAGAGAAAVVAGLALLLPAGPSATTTALVWLAAAATTVLAAALTAALRTAAGLRGVPVRRVIGDGAAVAAAAAALLTAPLALLVAA